MPRIVKTARYKRIDQHCQPFGNPMDIAGVLADSKSLRRQSLVSSTCPDALPVFPVIEGNLKIPRGRYDGIGTYEFDDNDDNDDLINEDEFNNMFKAAAVPNGAEEARAAEAKAEEAKAEEEARLKSEEEARLRAEEEARLRAEEEARLRAEEEARLKAEEEARLKAEEEARLKAEEEARLKAEAAAEEARLKAAAEEARLHAKEAAEEEGVRLEPGDEDVVGYIKVDDASGGGRTRKRKGRTHKRKGGRTRKRKGGRTFKRRFR